MAGVWVVVLVLVAAEVRAGVVVVIGWWFTSGSGLEVKATVSFLLVLL